jgi:F-type H+-transporting ATPase subunit delta
MIEPTTLARPYARAAFEYARAHGVLDQWLAQLGTLAQVAAEPRVEAMLKDPARTGAERADALLKLLGDDVDVSLSNFVSVMAENSRLELLPDVMALFEQLKADLEATVNVEVTSAYDLSSDELQQLSDALGARLERSISITSHTDSDPDRRVLIRAGDLVIDGSVRGRLNKLAGTLTP